MTNENVNQAEMPASNLEAPEGQEFVRCSRCRALVKPKNLKKHIKKSHGTLKPTHSLGRANAPKRPDWWIAERTGKAPPPPGKVKVKRKYYKCWQCGKLITKSSTASHLLKRHGVRAKDPNTAHFWYYDEVEKIQYREKSTPTPSPEGAKKAAKTRGHNKFLKDLDKLSKTKTPQGKPALIRCPCCNVSLSAQNLTKHMKKSHRQEMAKPVHDAPKGNPDQPKRKALDIKPDHEYSEDVFDRTKVYNGGAYGLGKSRKH